MKHNAPIKQWLNPISSAAALALLLAAGNAAALGLGSIHVHSNLGDVFSADVDVSAITPGEAEGLQVNLADPMAYEAAGLEMSPGLQGASVSLEKTADGRSYLKIRGVRPVNDPFIDILIQTNNTESGRATRGYTVLIDPPAGVIKAPKMTSPEFSVAPPKLSKKSAKPIKLAPVAPTQTEPAETKSEAAQAEPVAKAADSNADTVAGAETVRVQRGTTAGAIARQLASQQGVSFDQMLAALLRQNPQAFIGGNVNRIKAGAVLQAPSAEQANTVSQAEAKRQWMASGNNFKQYRRRLAQMDAATIDSSAGRSSSGSVTGEVEDHASAGVSRDKLTLGKARRRGTEDRALRKRHRAESSARQAELAKNIQELKKLSSSAEQGSATSANKAGAGVSLPSGTAPAKIAAPKLLPTPIAQATATPVPPAATATPEPTLASSMTAAASAPVDAASTPMESASMAESAASAASAAAVEVLPEPTVAPTVTAVPVKPAASQEEAGWLSKLSEFALPIGGLLGAGVLGGLGFALLRRRKAAAGAEGDSAAFLESKLEADSFFDASGGQQVDTSSRSSGISSSMVYSPSQLDAAGDVDPVAEAGVYMAYNRDQQAEDILKEAMRITPSRVAIYTTLMDIYAKRGDLKAFDVVAKEAHHLTGGQGEEWAKALELGRQFDPSNPMYGGADANGAETAEAVSYERPAAAPTAPMSLEQAQGSAKIETGDLDMVFRNSDFKLSESHDEAPSAPAHLATAPMQIESAGGQTDSHADAPTSHMDLNFDLGDMASDAAVPAVQETESKEEARFDLQFTEAGLSGQAPLAEAPEPLKFDMSDLSLDLTDNSAAEPVAQAQEAAASEQDFATTAGSNNDPWMTKLELAQEFANLGDSDGARAMAEEVVANASPELAAQAKLFIAGLA